MKRPSEMTDAEIEHWLNIAQPTSENHDRVLTERNKRHADRQYRLTLWGVTASNMIALSALVVAVLR